MTGMRRCSMEKLAYLCDFANITGLRSVTSRERHKENVGFAFRARWRASMNGLMQFRELVDHDMAPRELSNNLQVGPHRREDIAERAYVQVRLAFEL